MSIPVPPPPGGRVFQIIERARRARATFLKLSLAVMCGLAVSPEGGLAQELPDSIVQRILLLEARVDSLTALVARLEASGQVEEAQDAATRLRAAAEAAAAAGAAARPAADTTGTAPGLQRSLQALNPEISVTGDIVAVAREGSAGEDAVSAREFEISFISALDPYSRAKVFVAHHSEAAGISPFGEHEEGGEEGHEEEDGHGGGETEVEEGYIEWVNLPGSTALTLGKFRQRVGTYNRWHAHSLPWQQLPLAYTTFLGHEGLAQTGASATWLLPFEGGGAYELTVQATRSSSEEMFGESDDLSYLGHVNAFWDVSPSTYLELSATGLTGQFEHDDEAYTNRFLHLEGGVSWRPPEQARYREATLRGAVMWRNPDSPDTESAMGAFVTGEVRLGRSWLAGGRYDYVENPEEPDESAWMLAPTLTWWQSEFVRVRAEYDFLGGDVESFGQFVLQFTFAMGPHKHENY